VQPATQHRAIWGQTLRERDCQNRLTAAKSGIASITPFPENCDAIFAWGPLSLLAGNHQI
jgi:hypothetical protein